MCGIAGYIGEFDPACLEKMAEAIAHRGPDGRGTWNDADAGIGLVHTRLAIIDTSDAANQPMVSADQRYVTVFNGEIYNFRQLNRMLADRGYRLNTNSDTSCLAPLFDLHAHDMPQHLEGMFAIAIYDRETRELFLVRDHAGIKPLYILDLPQGIAFASEIKALLAIEGYRLDIDLSAIHEYVSRLWCPGYRTPVRQIKKLAPGEAICIRHGTSEKRRWHQIAKPVLDGEDVETEPRRLLNVFDQVVDEQCVSDVPIGAFLSGGVDSTAIVASMVRAGHRPTQTYCIGFDGPGLKEEGFGNDLEFARLAASELNVPLRPMIMDPITPHQLTRLVRTVEEPQADPAPLFVEQICAQARTDGIKVLMSGAGGDDIFSGYRRHRAAAIRQSIPGALRGALASALSMVSGGASPFARRAAMFADLMTGDDTAFVERCFTFNSPNAITKCLSADILRNVYCDQNEYWNSAMADSAEFPLLERLLYMERHGFLPDHNLNYTDKASMASGVEVRVPFLDTRILEFASKIPASLKTKRFQEKWFLKQALEARVPKAILHRKKTGFGGPVRYWVKHNLRELIEDTLSSSSFQQRGLFHEGNTRSLYQATLSGKQDHSYLLLAILMIELWMQEFIDDRQC